MTTLNERNPVKILTRIGVALALVAGLTLIGAPSAQAAEGDPGTASNPIIIEPREYVQVDACGTANDRFERVPGVGGAQQYSWVGPRQADGTYTAYFQTGPIGGVYYSFGPGTHNAYFPTLSEVTVRFPAFTDEPC